MVQFVNSLVEVEFVTMAPNAAEQFSAPCGIVALSPKRFKMRA